MLITLFYKNNVKLYVKVKEYDLEKWASFLQYYEYI